MFGSVRRRTASAHAWLPVAVARYWPLAVARAARFCRHSCCSAQRGGVPVSTIKSSREIDSIFRDSRRVAHPLVIALIAKTPEGRGHDGRVAFIAGKKLGPAVQRNRAKRVLREAARAAGGPWPGFDVALIATRKTGAARPAGDRGRVLAPAVSGGAEAVKRLPPRTGDAPPPESRCC